MVITEHIMDHLAIKCDISGDKLRRDVSTHVLVLIFKSTYQVKVFLANATFALFRTCTQCRIVLRLECALGMLLPENGMCLLSLMNSSRSWMFLGVVLQLLSSMLKTNGRSAA